MSTLQRRSIKTLQRRAAYLRSLKSDCSYDKAELSALEWALPNLEEVIRRQAEIIRQQRANIHAATPTPVRLVNDPWVGQEGNWPRLDATKPSFWKRIEDLKDSILQNGRDGGM